MAEDDATPLNNKKGYRDNIEELTLNNTDFRRVLYTGENIQLVLMTLKPGESIGAEVHADKDQFFRFDRNVLVFALLTAFTTVLLYGVSPALKASKLDLSSSLKEGGNRGATDAGSHRMRSALVVMQIGLSLSLLVMASLFMQSFLKINGIDPATGGNWQPGQIHMTAMDTARLLWLIHREDGTVWTRPDGEPVKASLLSDATSFSSKL